MTGTLVDEHLNPRIADVIKVINQYVPLMNPGQLVVLRSTVYPGVTQLIQEHFNKHLPGVSLAFCPERVAQGFAIEEIKNLPQIISGFDPVLVLQIKLESNRNICYHKTLVLKRKFWFRILGGGAIVFYA